MGKQEKKSDADIYSALAGTMDYFIRDMIEMQESGDNKGEYKKYIKNARQMKDKLLITSDILKNENE